MTRAGHSLAPAWDDGTRTVESNSETGGDVAKRQGRGLQNLHPQFESGRRLHSKPGLDILKRPIDNLRVSHWWWPTQDELARFTLIFAGAALLLYGAYLLSSQTRTSTTEERTVTVTAGSMSSSTRQTTNTGRDGRPSDTAVGLVFGAGAVLLFAGAFYNRKFSIKAPGGFEAGAEAAAKIAVDAHQRLITKHPQYTKHPDAAAKVVARAVEKALGQAPTKHAPQPRRFPLAPRIPSASTIDAMVDESVDEVGDSALK